MKSSRLSSADEKTQLTAIDSFGCKYVATTLKYLEDPIASIVYRKLVQSGVEFPRRSPIMNRGYYARVQSQNMALKEFLTMNPDQEKQILYLGCGFDTSGVLNYQLSSNIKTFEIDFPEIINQKYKIFSSEKKIYECLDYDPTNPSSLSDTTIFEFAESIKQLGKLTMISHDIRDATLFINKLIAAQFNPLLPTFVITECVLVYLNKDSVHQIIQALSTLIPTNLIWISYDMIRCDDIYGKMMVKNLTSAGFKLPGFLDFPTIESHKQKFLNASFETTNCIDMLRFYNQMISLEEKKRIMKLEILDEIEEWNLLMAHYSLTIAVKGETYRSIIPTVLGSL